MCFRGGGNRRGTRDIVREIELAAKQLGSEAAKVGRHCEIADEWLTRGARNIIHICDSNMNGSSEREAISRRYADSETKEVSEIKDAKALRRKGDKFVTEKDAICRHSERLAKESSLLQYIAAAKNENNSFETDHASKPLGIFASKSVSRKINVGGVGTPPYGAKNLAAKTLHKCMKYKPMLLQRATCVAPLPSCLAAKRVAFTLAEILITLGIIGVVAALTIPNVIKQYQDRVTVAKLQKAYSVLNQAFRQSENDNGSSELWQETPEISANEYFEKYWKPYFKAPELCLTYSDCGYKSWKPYITLNGDKVSMSIDPQRIKIKTSDDVFYMFTEVTTNSKGEFVPFRNVYIDINGAKAPNQFGVDVFAFRRIPGKGILPDGYAASYRSIVANCNRQASGAYCAARIIADGWKINY